MFQKQYMLVCRACTKEEREKWIGDVLMCPRRCSIRCYLRSGKGSFIHLFPDIFCSYSLSLWFKTKTKTKSVGNINFMRIKRGDTVRLRFPLKVIIIASILSVIACFMTSNIRSRYSENARVYSLVYLMFVLLVRTLYILSLTVRLGISMIHMSYPPLIPSSPCSSKKHFSWYPPSPFSPKEAVSRTSSLPLFLTRPFYPLQLRSWCYQRVEWALLSRLNTPDFSHKRDGFSKQRSSSQQPGNSSRGLDVMAAAAAQVVSNDGQEVEGGKYRGNSEMKEKTDESEVKQEYRKATGRSSPTLRMVNEPYDDTVSPSKSSSCPAVLLCWCFIV